VTVSLAQHPARPVPVQPPRRIGLIGHGRIGRAVAHAIGAGRAGAWQVAAILTTGSGATGTHLHHADAAAFFTVPVDLYLECAGPQALGQFGEAALQRADVWSVSGAALVDTALRARLEAAGTRHGHRLRLVAGAAGGLDAVQAMALDPDLGVDIAVVAPERCVSFAASVREAADRLPNGLNLAVAIALCGPGLDRTRVAISADPDPSHHAIGVRVRSAYGSFESRLMPSTDPSRDLHIAAASLLAALRQADSVIWVG
jgi:aspartate dehydrogenase